MVSSNTISDFQRGFPVEEFETRTARAQELMRAQALDALLFTTEPEFAYFSGFNSYFWQSPTRPWFLLVPATGKPTAVVPSIGANSLSQTWVEVVSWPSPNPEDEGISVLAGVIRSFAGTRKRIGVPMGPETQIRMPASDFETLKDRLDDLAFVDATGIVRSLRLVKSEREINKHVRICGLVSDVFENVPRLVKPGMTERDACRAFRIDVMARGADSAPYLIGTSGPGGIDDAIRFPTDRQLEAGDVLFFDTGSEIDGYYSDFDRNFALGHASTEVRRAYELVYQATEAGMSAVRPGARTCDVWKAMANVLASGGATSSSIGRMGHGLGLRNTEWPSIMEGDTTLIVPNMVLTIEPGFEFAPGRMMLHEENVVVREDGIELLSRRAAPELPIIPW